MRSNSQWSEWRRADVVYEFVRPWPLPSFTRSLYLDELVSHGHARWRRLSDAGLLVGALILLVLLCSRGPLFDSRTSEMNERQAELASAAAPALCVRHKGVARSCEECIFPP